MADQVHARGASKFETSYTVLRERILSGEYVTGYRLVLGQISKEMKMSPLPVRESIRRLEAEGLVKWTPNVGAEVASVDFDKYGDAMETLAVLEGFATALSAANLSNGQLVAASEVNAQLRSLIQGAFNAERYAELNREFHSRLSIACPNGSLLETMDREWHRVAVWRRPAFAFDREWTHQSVEDHDELLSLIRIGAKQSEIEEFARQHKLKARRRYLQGRDRSD